MTESKVVDLLAVFPDLEPAANAIEHLRSIGVHDDCMNVISGVPVTEAMLGRPSQWTNVPRIAMGGAILGFSAGFFLAYISPWPLLDLASLHPSSLSFFSSYLLFL